MSITPAMKKMLQKMTREELDAVIATASQPRLTMDLTEHVLSNKGKKKAQRDSSANKATRALNSWMAFRSKYKVSETSEE